MNPYQLIDALCHITSLQADIIRRQQAVIMQHGIEVEDPEMERLLAAAEEKLNGAERQMRNI